MPRYRLNADHYLQEKRPGAKPSDENVWKREPRLHAKGSVIDWDGKPSMKMDPVDGEAKERVDARRAEFSEAREKGRVVHGRTSIGWTPTFERNMATMLGSSPSDDAPVDSAPRRRRRAV